jgi:hypothetical protein
LLGAGLLLALVAAGVLARGYSEQAGGQANGPVAEVHVSWDWSYSSLDELRAAADVVVAGRIASVVSAEDESAPGIAASLATVTVDRAIKGAAGPTITVKQTGGTLDGVFQRVSDDPLMERGNHVVLYLKFVDSGPYAGDYYILGGPQGRLAVSKDGALRSIGGVPVPRGVTETSIR